MDITICECVCAYNTSNHISLTSLFSLSLANCVTKTIAKSAKVVPYKTYEFLFLYELRKCWEKLPTLSTEQLLFIAKNSVSEDDFYLHRNHIIFLALIYNDDNKPPFFFLVGCLPHNYYCHTNDHILNGVNFLIFALQYISFQLASALVFCA